MEEGGMEVRVVGNYVLEKRIGSGSFSVVWRARHIHHHDNKFAVKEISTGKLCRQLRDRLMLEIDILRQINHPNIVGLYDIVNHPHQIFLVMEYCSGGDLAAYIKSNGRLSEAVARQFMIQLAAGLKVLREKNLIHRDLKPLNLLLSSNDRNAVLKIADFGLARPIQPEGLAETLCGSPLYMAPEIMQSGKYDAKADLWSVGTILFELVTGNPPFSGKSQMDLLHNIMKSNDLHFPVDIVGDLLPDCIDLCKKLLRRNPIERLSFEEFFNHRFMQVQTVRSIGHREDNSMGFPGNSVVETAEGSVRPVGHHENKSMGFSGNSVVETAEASVRPIGHHEDNSMGFPVNSVVETAEGSVRPVAHYENKSMGFPGNSVVETAETSVRLIGHHEDNSMGFPGNSVVETAETSQDADCLPCKKNSPASKEEASDNLDRATNYMECCSFNYKLQGSFESTPLEGVQTANVEEPVDKISTIREGNSLECIEKKKAGLVKYAKEIIYSFLDAYGLQHSESKAVQGSFGSAPLEVVQAADVEELVDRISTIGLGNSIECIEEEKKDGFAKYAKETFSSWLHHSEMTKESFSSWLHHSESKAKETQKRIIASVQVFGTENCWDSLKSQSSVPMEASDKPSDHAPTRLDSLRRYAPVISEVAKEKLKAGKQLEALAIQLVCLAIRKQALRVCHKWSATLTETSPSEDLEGDFQRAASSCLEMEQDFLSAVESAEELSSHLGPLDNNAEMPDAMEIVFQTALALGRKGAVNELLGAMDNATALYLKSITLLSFILVEASSLELIPPFSLSIFDRQRLHRYIDRLTHHKQSIAHSTALVKQTL